MSIAAAERKQVIKSIVCDILELESENVVETGLFQEDYNADSLRSIEILASLEKEFKIQIPQSELNNMVNLAEVYTIVKKYAGWSD